MQAERVVASASILEMNYNRRANRGGPTCLQHPRACGPEAYRERPTASKSQSLCTRLRHPTVGCASGDFRLRAVEASGVRRKQDW